MARVTDQNMPVDIRLALGDVLHNTDPVSGPGRIIKINPRASARPAVSAGGALVYFSANTGRWFHRNWGSTLPRSQRADFRAARQADVLTSEYPAEWWYQAAVLEDVTELARPAWVLPSRGRLDPEFWDATHRPGNCPITRIAATYPTPSGDGTPEQPAPGWAGQVEDRVFGDLYQAQRRLLFALPRDHTPNTERPVALRIGASIEAQASHRGSDAWFIVVSRPYWWHTSAGSPPAPPDVLTDWTVAQVVPFILPADSVSPWRFEHQVTVSRNAEIGGALDYFTPYNRLWVRVATPPSRGRYFLRNDWVRVLVRSTVEVFMARGPRG